MLTELDQSVHQYRKDDDVVGIERLPGGVLHAPRPADLTGDFLQRIRVEDVVGVEMNYVVTGSLAYAPVAQRVAPVVVASRHGDDGDRAVDARIEQRAVVV